MIVNHIHQALAQVKQLRAKVLEAQKFRGWSGRARGITGIVAAVATAAIMLAPVPKHTTYHLLAWMGVLAISLVISGSALLYWFLFDPKVGRDWHKLRPLLELAPPLVIGAAVSSLLIMHGQWQWVFGIWMCHYGLANLALRRVLPNAVALVGLFYLVCGVVCLFLGTNFCNPLPMGLVFGVGEMAGGWILHNDLRRSIE